MTTPTLLTADQIASALAPPLKQRGFRKRRLTWCKNLGDLTVLFHIQRSQWSRDVWYYVFGIAVNAFAKQPVTSCDQNHIQYRCDCGYDDTCFTPEQVLRIVDAWEARYGSIPLLCQNLAAGTIPLHSIGCNGYQALCALSEMANIPAEKQFPDYWFSETDFAQDVLSADVPSPNWKD